MPYANNNGAKIHYEVEGNGPPIVMQGGLTMTIESWHDFGYVKALKEDYLLILVDARGHGASDKPHDVASYAPEIISNDYVRILDALGIRRAHYWGYSLGPMVGFRCIARYALARFNSLILGGGGPYGNQSPAERESMQMMIDAIGSAIGKGPEAWLALLERRGAKLRGEELARQVKNDPAALVALLKALGDVDSGDALPSIRVPCLVYAGEADSTVHKLRQAVGLLPEATFFSLPNLDHGQAWTRACDLVVPHVR